MRWAAIVLMGVLAVGTARGEATVATVARRAYEKGMVAYNLQRFDEAFDMFSRAYEEVHDAAFLFNIGQCQRQLGQYAAAARSYRTYVSLLPGAPNREQAVRLAERMDEAVHEAQAKVPPTGIMSPQPPAVQVADMPPPWYKSPLGWSLVGSGLAVAGVGGGLLAHGVELDGQIVTASSLAQADQLAADRDRYRPAGITLLATGAAASIAGFIVLAVGARRPHSRLHASIMPLGGLQ